MQAEIRSQRIPMDPLLYKAAREGDINLLEDLLTSKGEQQLQQVQYVQPGEEVAIRVANWGGAVMSRGRQLNCLLGVTYSGDTALHIASYFGHSEVVWRICNENRSLLLRGNNKSETPLHYAAQAGKDELVSYFIHVARVEPQIGNIFQPEGVDVLKELVRKKNQDGETALYQAVHNKHFSVVEILVNADPHLASISDNNNASPLYVAAMRDLPDIVHSLTESLRGIVQPEAYAGPDGQTALHAATFGQRGVYHHLVMNSS
jgi:Ankyrin repeats (3 copies)